jgi:hypothetical protein
MWCRVDLVLLDVSEERIASIFRIEKSANEEVVCSHLLKLVTHSRIFYFFYLCHYRTKTYAYKSLITINFHISLSVNFQYLLTKLSPPWNLIWGKHSLLRPEFFFRARWTPADLNGRGRLRNLYIVFGFLMTVPVSGLYIVDGRMFNEHRMVVRIRIDRRSQNTRRNLPQWNFLLHKPHIYDLGSNLGR